MPTPKKDPGRPPSPVIKGTFGALVREAREGKKWTQPELARRSGVEQSTVSRTGRDVIQPDLGTRILIAQAFETDFNDPDLTEFVARIAHEVPIVGRVAAGKPIERQTDRSIRAGADIASEADLAFQVEGESMVDDHILDEDVLLCREAAAKDVQRNAVTVVEFDDDTATVKRWRPKGQSVTLGAETYSIKRIRRVFEVVGLIRTMK